MAMMTPCRQGGRQRASRRLQTAGDGCAARSPLPQAPAAVARGRRRTAASPHLAKIRVCPRQAEGKHGHGRQRHQQAPEARGDARQQLPQFFGQPVHGLLQLQQGGSRSSSGEAREARRACGRLPAICKHATRSCRPARPSAHAPRPAGAAAAAPPLAGPPASAGGPVFPGWAGTGGRPRGGSLPGLGHRRGPARPATPGRRRPTRPPAQCL